MTVWSYAYGKVPRECTRKMGVTRLAFAWRKPGQAPASTPETVATTLGLEASRARRADDEGHPSGSRTPLTGAFEGVQAGARIVMGGDASPSRDAPAHQRQRGGHNRQPGSLRSRQSWHVVGDTWAFCAERKKGRHEWTGARAPAQSLAGMSPSLGSSRRGRRS